MKQQGGAGGWGGVVPNTPVCSQDPGHDCISDPVIDRLPVGTADEELVLRADERKQMAAQHAALASRRYTGGPASKGGS